MNPTAPPDPLVCHRCRRPLASGEGRPVALFYRLAAALSLGPVHAGMWLWTDLNNPHCRSCRRWVSFLALVLATMALALAGWGFRWAFREKLLFNG
ncbi:MAG TPA: hypothetical protein PKZ00_02815 [Elusimicrobiota bacterium]|jgi:hypothetical protein|nr:hypothetical protein [Elusimicrobiota bacterium]HMU96311.1 hypothetical protein [Elusimicrobiota bacterium]HMX94802.1 hypothetical protein [Elusimicrobiota bacterium]HNA59521.1 hypothetical protein [Elusimicrobiota bacterium]HNC74413.1 hypothetical protein [Elusimicrobiota bacterium]